MKCFRVPDLSRKINRSEKTILSWHKDKLLPAINEKRQPFLFRGYDIIQCINKLKDRRKQPDLELHEFNCRRCNEPQKPKGKRIAFAGAIVIGVCPVCSSKMTKIFSPAQIPDVKKFFTIVEKARLCDSDTSPLNFQILTIEEQHKKEGEQQCMKF